MSHSPKFCQLVDDALTRIKETTVEEISQRAGTDKSLVLIDVREHHEWHRGRLPGAVHLCKGILERDIEKLYPDVEAELVLYCGGGNRSALAADNLQKMGYKQVFSLAGGYRAWTEAGLDVVV